MTRPFEGKYHCANCKTWQTQETDLGRLVRTHPELSSALGYVVTDLDWMVTEYKVIHQYKTQYGRTFQLMMIVESKIMGAEISDTQRDTLQMRNQIISNRRQTPTKDLVYQAGVVPTEVYSSLSGKKILLRVFGVHSLRFSGLGPSDSEWIKWDKKEITIEQLVGLFRFNLDPDTLKPIDLRNHHAVVNRLQTSLLEKEAVA